MILGFRLSSTSHFPITLAVRRFHISSFLKFLVKSHLIKQNPFIKSEHNSKKIKTLNFLLPSIQRWMREWEKYYVLRFVKTQKNLISMASCGDTARESIDVKSEKEKQKQKKEKACKDDLHIEGYSIRGLSIAGHETCVILPSLNLAFDIGKCPQQAISQKFLLISHGHMDHIGGLPLYVAARGLNRMEPPTVIVPKVIKESVEKIFEAHMAMDQSGLQHTLVGLDVGEEVFIRKDVKVRAFRTYHVIPSQGYIVYSVKQKLKQEYIGLPGDELKSLKLSGVEITDSYTIPEVAFTGDTMSDFNTDADNADVLRAKILIMESTYVENSCTVEDAKNYGHTHLSEIISQADRFHNKAILLIHFSARYQLDVIENALSTLPPSLAGRVFALTNGFQ